MPGARAAAFDLSESVRAFHALSDATRLRLVELLRSGERCVCELTEAVGGGQSRLSFHLKVLKEAGLVEDRKDGRWVYYRLNPDQVQRLAGLLTNCCSRDRQSAIGNRQSAIGNRQSEIGNHPTTSNRLTV